MPIFNWTRRKEKEALVAPDPDGAERKALADSGVDAITAARLDAAIRQAPERLQAMFLRDDIQDLQSAIGALSALPGIQGATLGNRMGQPLAEQLDRAVAPVWIIKAAAQLLGQSTERFQVARHDHNLDTVLESVSFHLGTEQITGFAADQMHLLIMHSARPFRPGVREKVQTCFDELVRLSRLPSH
jgi:hypothetical protein